jgi:hypothetical protein
LIGYAIWNGAPGKLIYFWNMAGDTEKPSLVKIADLLSAHGVEFVVLDG